LHAPTFLIFDLTCPLWTRKIKTHHQIKMESI
jgi:hypothetical protein